MIKRMQDKELSFEEDIKNLLSWTGVVEEADAGRRLDVFLAECLNDWAGKTRSFIQNRIKESSALVNGKVQKANYKLKAGDRIEFFWPAAVELDVKPENIDIEIVYQDEDIVVVNKEKGMVVHPAPGHESGTLVNALLHHINDLAGIGGVLRPGIVHRIDKDTSGLLVVAKNDLAHQSLSEQIKVHSAGRIYVAIIQGYLPESPMSIDKAIGRSLKDRKKMAIRMDGREAITHLEEIERYKGFSLLRCTLETGRTHQIRVHLASIQRPILGDTVYGSSKAVLGMDTQALHACELHLRQPRTGKEMCFKAPPPDDFLKMVSKLRKEVDLPEKNGSLGW